MSDIFSVAMRRAIVEAAVWAGATAPNPPVGAVALDKTGNVIAVAAHQRAGRAHAEAALLDICRAQNILGDIDTLCVTLEPCNHTGRTPPCSEAIIAAGIRRVVIGANDPNPHVAGGGAARLRQAGIEIVEGVENELCRRLIAPFAFYAATGRAFVVVKRAFDETGSMIPPVGQKVFASPESLVAAHRLRRKADAIVTGSGTVLADAPLFTVRHVADHAGKRRVLAILDRRGRVPQSYLQQARDSGLEPVIYTDIDFCLRNLAARGARDILVEAGACLCDAILASGQWVMRVDIHKGTPDRIHVAFNPNQNIGFDIRGVGLSELLF